MRTISKIFLVTFFSTSVYAVDGDGSGTPESNSQDNRNGYVEIKVDGDGSGISTTRKPNCITIKVDGDGSGKPFLLKRCLKIN